MSYEATLGRAAKKFASLARAPEPAPHANSLRRGGLAGMFRSFGPGEDPEARRGRRHFAQGRSDERPWRPGRRLVCPRASGAEGRASSGRRPLRPKPSEERDPSARGRRYLAARERSGHDLPDAWQAQACRGRRAVRQDGVRAQDRSAGEFTLEDAIARRRKLPPAGRARTLALRNGIPEARPGDKLYTDPSRAPGFYRGGEVIPGSSNVARPKNGGPTVARAQASVMRRRREGLDGPGSDVPARNCRREAHPYRKLAAARALARDYHEVRRLESAFGGEPGGGDADSDADA